MLFMEPRQIVNAVRTKDVLLVERRQATLTIVRVKELLRIGHTLTTTAGRKDFRGVVDGFAQGVIGIEHERIAQARIEPHLEPIVSAGSPVDASAYRAEVGIEPTVAV